MRSLHSFIDRQARWVTDWLHSRSAYVILVYGTILWIPLVILGLDQHGFIYLYIATSLSLITQVPLAMLAYMAMQEGKNNEILIIQTLQNQKDMITFLLAQQKEHGEILKNIKDEQGDLDHLLEEIHGEVHPRDE